jgi:hypothetical protein
MIAEVFDAQPDARFIVAEIDSPWASNDAAMVTPSARYPLSPLMMSRRASPRISLAWQYARYGGNTPSGLCVRIGMAAAMITQVLRACHNPAATRSGGRRTG